MRLAETIKPGTVAEVLLNDGTLITIGAHDPVYQLEYLDDDAQQLGFLVTILAGRRRGQKAKMVVPYTVIRSVTVMG